MRHDLQYLIKLASAIQIMTDRSYSSHHSPPFCFKNKSRFAGTKQSRQLCSIPAIQGYQRLACIRMAYSFRKQDLLQPANTRRTAQGLYKDTPFSQTGKQFYQLFLRLKEKIRNLFTKCWQVCLNGLHHPAA
jgi:hypothetical protein